MTWIYYVQLSVDGFVSAINLTVFRKFFNFSKIRWALVYLCKILFWEILSSHDGLMWNLTMGYKACINGYAIFIGIHILTIWANHLNLTLIIIKALHRFNPPPIINTLIRFLKFALAQLYRISPPNSKFCKIRITIKRDWLSDKLLGIEVITCFCDSIVDHETLVEGRFRVENSCALRVNSHVLNLLIIELVAWIIFLG